MERVVTINLNGNPYQLEEPAYDALRAYLARAAAALAANPDQAEIIRDLEQAIADKCAAYLNPHKRVISASEMARVLEEMGPVEGESAAREGARDYSEDAFMRPPRRLYRIYDRGAWTGVSAGLAAYAGIDATWVRAFWILSAIFTGGVTALIYLVLVFAMPVAATSEDLAAAHGAPFNAQEVVERAKREYARFTDENAPRWRAAFREQSREWRERARRWSSGRWDYAAHPAAPPPPPVGYATRMIAGLFALIFSVITAALLIAFLVAFFSLLGAGSVLGWTPPAGVPLWLALIILAIVYAAISAPFSAMRRSSYATASGHRSAASGVGDGIATFAIVVVSLLIAWMFWPEARALMEQAYYVTRDFLHHWDDGAILQR
ncbi:MAG: PspC domain-containing protein [Hyphomonadaceae bacterium]|nr:PspC domain-containing protein [Hyphomonadaceae bacterium]